MAKFVIMHVGFEPPTAEIMQAWGKWFSDHKDKTVENVGFRKGREISKSGASDLEMDKDAITGLSIIEAQSMEAAEQIAAENPYITAVRVYEVMQHG